MRKRALKKFLLLLPVVVLLGTLFFLNYTVQHFKDTAYTFVYETNVGSVLSFAEELRALSSQGYKSDKDSVLFTNMIMNFNRAMGEKEAIVTFLMDADGEFHHSSEYNQNFLSGVLQSGENMNHVQAAYDKRGSGEITLEHPGGVETMFYHRFYSGPKEYSLFLCVEKHAIEAQLNVNGVIIPISMIGLLLLFALEYGVLHLVRDDARAEEVRRKREEQE